MPSYEDLICVEVALLGFSLFWTISTSPSLPISRQKLGLGFIKTSLTCLYVLKGNVFEKKEG
jgi:hypothetical protein